MKHRYDSLLNGFSATLPESVLTSFQSLQGDVIDYIGTILLHHSNQSTLIALILIQSLIKLSPLTDVILLLVLG